MATDRKSLPTSATTLRLTPATGVVLICAAAGFIGLAVFTIVVALAASGKGEAAIRLAGPQLTMVVSAAILALVAGLGSAWLAINHWIMRPIASLAEDAQFIAEANAERRIEGRRYLILQPLPEVINAVARELAASRGEVSRSVATATGRVEEQKSWLEAILRDLSEGVVVCNLEHQILLYNQAALSIFHVVGELGLGRTLFNLITREPVLHTLDRLLTQPPGAVRDATQTVVCATVDSGALLRGRMSLILDPAHKAGGYVLTFSDVTREVDTLGRRDALLRAATEGLRAPLANLRAAIETLTSYPDMPPEQRRAFDEVVLRESDVLSARVETLDHDYRKLGGDHWPMADIHSVDLLNAVIRRLAAGSRAAVTMVGVPLWLHGDSHALVLALERILGNLANETGTLAFDVEALLGDRRVYVEISWEGIAISSARLDAWLAEALPGALGALTLRDVLVRHGSEIWSRPQRQGHAMLRLPLPAPDRMPFDHGRGRDLPPRPEFYDFNLLHLPPAGEGIGSRPLRSLTYVVFDTEATGLSPSKGDEMVSIAGVRVVHGRILTGETFSRLVNPRRTIPSESTRIHGITDEMVADAPPIEVVLPQFKAFVADAILVAHSAAFDLSLIHRRQDEAGTKFDNLTLDSMLISYFLYPDMDDHSLDALATRLGLEIDGRHTAAGDAMATAAVFVKLLDSLEARGIVTLEALIRASNMTLEIKARKAHF